MDQCRIVAISYTPSNTPESLAFASQELAKMQEEVKLARTSEAETLHPWFFSHPTTYAGSKAWDLTSDSRSKEVQHH